MEIKDKPESMSVREWITKKVATGIMIPENIIRRVIAHQFDSAYEALKDNNSIEISGFGKFYYNKKRAKKEIQLYEKEKDSCEKRLISSSTTEKERREIEKRLKFINKQLDHLYHKEDGKV